MAMVLYAEQGNKNAYKSLIAAEYFSVKVDRVFETGAFDQTHLFLNNNVFAVRNQASTGMEPVLETPDGLIVDSHSMLLHLGDNNTLCGSSAYESAEIEQWMAITTSRIDEVLTRWIYIRTGVYPYVASAESFLLSCLRKCFGPLNNYLAKKGNYLVGNRISLADIVLVCDLYPGFTKVLTKSFSSKFTHVDRYFWNLVSQPNFKKVLGEVKQAECVPKVGPVMLDVPEVLFDYYHAVKSERPDLMMGATEEQEEVEVNNQMVMKTKRLRLLIHPVFEGNEEANNQKMTKTKEVIDHMKMKANKGKMVNNQMMKAKKAKRVNNSEMMEGKEELNHMTEEQRERITQMVLNDDAASCDAQRLSKNDAVGLISRIY